MIPVLSDLIIDFTEAEEIVQPSITYKADFDGEKINGTIDGIDAVKQSVFCRLMTECGAYPIYSDKYGLPMNDLIGKPAPLIYVQIADAVTETLLDDDRITGVSNFIFDTGRKNVTVTFTVDTIFGNLRQYRTISGCRLCRASVPIFSVIFAKSSLKYVSIPASLLSI